MWNDFFFWRKTENKSKSMWENLKPIDLAKIEVVNFPDNKFFHDINEKTQIVLHHTISGDGVDGDITTWEHDKDNVAVAIIIDRAGTPWQLFSSKYWAYHLGAGNHDLDRHSIGVELDNWGWLVPGDGTVKYFNNPPQPVQTVSGKYYTYYGNSVAVPLQYYPDGYRGYNYYEKYSNSQIQTAGELILYWKLKYNIPLTYNEDIWQVSQRALSGTSGIWSHVSYLPAPIKEDCHPQPELIDLLKTLSTL
jgi:N-acetylmuramoyl-L-alanine amidase